MISALKWIPRGAASEFPQKADLDDEEMSRIAELSKMELDDAKLDLEEAMAADGPEGTSEIVEEIEEDVSNGEDESAEDAEPEDPNADPMDKYHMSDYDDEDADTSQSAASWNAVTNVRGLAYHAPDEKDEYLQGGDDDAAEDREDLQILPTDNLILAAKTEDDVSVVEVYVYDDTQDTETSSLYVHHDFMLPSFPLCVEWVPFKVGSSNKEAGNFAAIGTFEPEIELWNIDIVDTVYPAAILGQRPKDSSLDAKGTGKKKKHLKKSNPAYHTDAVLSLSSNPSHVNLLASGSADTTVKLWDLEQCKALKSFDFHDSKVSCVKWNPAESTVLLSGGYDHYAMVSDLQSTDASRKFRVEGDVECVCWHPNGYNFFVGNDQGMVYKFDARKEDAPVWTLSAHDSEITAFDVNTFSPDFMVTGSSDKKIKLWNLTDDKPSMLLSRYLDVGKVFSVGFAPDKEIGGMLAVAGSEGKLKIWNSYSNRAVRGAMAKDYHYNGNDQVIAVDNDVNDDEDQEMEEE